METCSRFRVWKRVFHDISRWGELGVMFSLVPCYYITFMNATLYMLSYQSPQRLLNYVFRIIYYGKQRNTFLSYIKLSYLTEKLV